MYAVHHPGTGKRAHDVQASTLSDIQCAVSTCQAALASWSSLGVKERCKIVTRAAELLEDRASGWSERLRDANRLETDIGDWWSQVQVEELAGALRTLVGSAEEAMREETVEIPGCT